MQNNKLISLLLSFSSHELVRFRKYIISPFFNENKELVLLFDAIRPNLLSNNKTEKPFGKLGLWSKVFKKKKYDDTRFRRICSDLLRLAMGFLAYSQYNKTSNHANIHLLNAIGGTPLTKHFNGTVRQMDKELSTSQY